MELCINKPDCAGDDVIFCLPSNIDRQGRMISDSFCVTREKIIIYADKAPAVGHELKSFKELRCVKRFGSSVAQGITEKGGIVFLCAFTSEHFLRYAELFRILNHYLRTGELYTESTAPEPSCPKCGHPLGGRKTCLFCAKKRSVVGRLISLMAPYKKYYITAIVCMMLSVAASLALPAAQRYIIDNYVTPRIMDIRTILSVAGGVLFLNVFSGFMGFINMRLSFRSSLAMGRDIREMVFRKSQAISMASSAKRTAGEMINRVSSDAARIEEFFTANGRDLIVNIFTAAVTAVIMFVTEPRLSLFVVLPLPVICFIITKTENDVMDVYYTKTWKKDTECSEILHDAINGIKVIKTYGNERYEIEKYRAATAAWRKSCTRADINWYYFFSINEIILSLANFLAVYIGGRLVLGGEMTVGMLVQYTVYLTGLYGPVRWISRIPRELSETMVSAGKVFELIDEEDESAESENASDADIKGDISFRDVYFGYEAYDPVLKGISFDIKQGEMIGIVGHSGAGKTTLINLIMRLYTCTGGEILIDGRDIKDITLQSLRSQIGVVLQETFLFGGTILENITYAKPDATFEEAVRAAKTANAHDFITRLPDGYNTDVGSKGYRLSGGERQRIAIARAILHDPKVIILDEATSALDTRTEKLIQEALQRLIKGRTTIAIAHRLSTLSSADRLIVLDKGRLAETGTHEELMENKGVYYKLVMAQRQTARLKEIRGDMPDDEDA